MIKDVDHTGITGNDSVEIEHIEYDSRRVKKNSLFVAVTGYAQDGYDFVSDAVKNGAVAVLGQRNSFDGIDTHISVVDTRKALADLAAKFYGYPGLKIPVCGVTGTNGKTTTCYLIKNILLQLNMKVGLLTSNIYDTGKEIFKADRTTPESLDLQRLLFLMVENECEQVVLEVSSHALMLHRVDNIDFQVAVYTNLTRDHLDFHNTMEEYFEAKSKLMDMLGSRLGRAVINLDVPEFRSLFGDYKADFITYSIDDNSADIHCDQYEIRPEGTTFDLVTPSGRATVKLKLPGRFNLTNAVAAAGGGLACGADLDTIVRGLEVSEPIPGRFNYIDCGQPFGVFIDFAHTSDAIERLCQSARELCSGRLMILFGCGGDRDKGKRPLMGKAATEFADYAVLTSDNPRSEDPLAIIEDVKPGLTGDNYKIIPDRKEAVESIIREARPGDIVLIAGKGAENYQEIKGVKHSYSDYDVAVNILGELGFSKQEVRE